MDEEKSNGYPAFQWSKFSGPDKSEQYVVRAQTFEDFKTMLDNVKGLLGTQDKLPLKAAEPVKYEAKDLPVEDVEVCPLHQARMFQNPWGKYQHGEKQEDGTWRNCIGSGWYQKKKKK